MKFYYEKFRFSWSFYDHLDIVQKTAPLYELQLPRIFLDDPISSKGSLLI